MTVVRKSSQPLGFIASALNAPGAKRARAPLLVQAPIRIEVQVATKRHHRPCSSCGMPARPLRTVVTTGSGKTSSSAVLCTPCALPHLDQHIATLVRASWLLRNPSRVGSFTIRIEKDHHVAPLFDA
jgi:hypothetical protein